MHEVFISYSSLDKPIADAVVHYLEERGTRCWYAPRDIHAGDTWEEKIMDAIHQARIFVLIFSQKSNDSKQVRNEVSNACAAGCVIIPFRIDTSEMSQGLAYYLRSVHWMDATNDELRVNMEALCGTVKAILHGDPPPQPAAKSPMPETPKTPLKRKAVWHRILAAVLVIALGLGVFFGVRNAPQDAYFFCISHIGALSYPGFGSLMLSAENKQIVLQDRGSGQLVSVSVEDPYRSNWEAEIGMENPLDTMVIQTQSNPYVFFLDNITKTVGIFNREQQKWVAEDIRIPNLKESEFAYSYFYYNPHMLADSNLVETVVILFYDADPEVDCITKLIMVSCEGVGSVLDITHLNLIEFICLFNGYEATFPVLMMDKGNHPVLLGIQNGEVISTDMHIIYEEYLPNARISHNMISPNKRYVICRDTTYDVFGDRLTVWDMKTGDRVFSHEDPLLCDIYFTDDNMLIYYDHTERALYSLDPEGTGTPVCVMDEDDFARDRSFLNDVYDFFHSPELQAYFFVSASPGFMDKGVNIRVTVTDRTGKVMAKSEKIHMENRNVSVNMGITDEAVVVVITSRDQEFAAEDEHTAIYRALYTVDADGKLHFKDS